MARIQIPDFLSDFTIGLDPMTFNLKGTFTLSPGDEDEDKELIGFFAELAGAYKAGQGIDFHECLLLIRLRHLTLMQYLV